MARLFNDFGSPVGYGQPLLSKRKALLAALDPTSADAAGGVAGVHGNDIVYGPATPLIAGDERDPALPTKPPYISRKPQANLPGPGVGAAVGGIDRTPTSDWGIDRDTWGVGVDSNVLPPKPPTPGSRIMVDYAPADRRYGWRKNPDGTYTWDELGQGEESDPAGFGWKFENGNWTYVNGPGGGDGGGGGGGGTSGGGGPTYGGGGGTGTGGGGGGASGIFSGFNLAREQNPSKSAKDAFAQLAGLTPPTEWTKAGAEAWFKASIAPGMEALGYKIYEVKGDKVRIGTRENPNGEWVDFMINAGGDPNREPPSLAWQSEMAPGAKGAGGGGGTAAATATTVSNPWNTSGYAIDPFTQNVLGGMPQARDFLSMILSQLAQSDFLKNYFG